MTSGEAPAWLRAKVLEQIESPRASRWTGVPAWRWLGATAIVVLAVAGSVWILRPAPTTPPSGGPAGTGPAVGQPVLGGPVASTGTAPDAAPDITVASKSPAASSPAGAGPLAPKRRVDLPPRSPAGDLGNAVPGAEEPGIDPWVTVDMIREPDPITIRAVSVRPLEVAGVRITEVRIDPLDPGQPEQR